MKTISWLASPPKNRTHLEKNRHAASFENGGHFLISTLMLTGFEPGTH